MTSDRDFFQSVLTAGAIISGFCGSFLVFRIQREASYFRYPGLGDRNQQHLTPSLLLLIVATLALSVFSVCLPLLALAGRYPQWLGPDLRPTLLVWGLTFSIFTLGAYVVDELVHYRILCPLRKVRERRAPKWLRRIVKVDWYGFRREWPFLLGGLAIAALLASYLAWSATSPEVSSAGVRAVSLSSVPPAASVSLKATPTTSPSVLAPSAAPEKVRPSLPQHQSVGVRHDMLANLLSGLIGAIIGFLALIWGQWHQESRRKIGAGRAVLAELVMNAERAIDAQATTVHHDLMDLAWRSQLPLLSLRLKWNETRLMVSTYDGAVRLNEMVRNLKDEDIRKPRVRENFLEMAADFLRTSEMLFGKVLRGSDRCEFRGQLEKLRQRIEVFQESVEADRVLQAQIQNPRG